MRSLAWSVAAVCLLAAGSVRAEYVTFSTDPNLASDWTQYAFYGPNNGTATWDSADQNLSLSTSNGDTVSGLYKNGTTRADTDTTTVTFSNIDFASSDWSVAGLAISAVQEPTLTGDPPGSSDQYRFELEGTSGDIDYRVLTAGGTPIAAYSLTTGTASVTLSIVPSGSDYLFEGNGVTIFTEPKLGVSLPYYAMYWGTGGSTTMSVSADNFGVPPSIPEPGTLSLLAAGVVGLACCGWRKRK